MIGLVGGFEIGKLTSTTTGYTFSKFEQIEENYRKQADELIEFIKGYWKERAKNSKKEN